MAALAALADTGLDRVLDRVAGLRLAAGLAIALTPARATVRAMAPKARVNERWTDRLNSGLSERRAISATAAKIQLGWAHQDIAAAWSLSRRFELSSAESLLAHRQQIRTTPMRHLSSYANTSAERGVRMNCLADIDCVCSHLDSPTHFTNHFGCVGSKPQAFFVSRKSLQT